MVNAKEYVSRIRDKWLLFCASKRWNMEQAGR